MLSFAAEYKIRDIFNINTFYLSFILYADILTGLIDIYIDLI